jgi:hypothetical protein
MKKPLFILSLFVLTSIPMLFAESRSGPSFGTLESVTVVASTTVDVIYANHGETPDAFRPYPFDGDWSFTWNGNQVRFAGVIRLGSFQTITDAGSMGGVTIQTFYDFAHNLSGIGRWNSASRTLTFEMIPDGRDDARASRATWSREAECEKVRGMFAGVSCSAFKKSSPGLEGVKLTFRFKEDLSGFEGEAILIQFGGKGATESETTMVTRIRGDLR